MARTDPPGRSPEPGPGQGRSAGSGAGDFEGQVAGVAALHDPVRRSLYRVVVDSPTAVSREQAAGAVGIRKGLAAFHLDKLAAEGLLDVEYRRLTGRSGPGAGRPAKLYRRSELQIAVSLPPREYDLAGLLLASAIESADRRDSKVRHELERTSFAFGQWVGQQVLARAGSRATRSRQREALLDVLREHAFEPRSVDGDIVLGNCPFHALAQQFTDLVCGMNFHLLAGVRSVLDLGDGELQPELAPEPGRCCVRFCSADPGQGRGPAGNDHHGGHVA